MFKISGILLTFISVAFPLTFSQLLRKYNEAPKASTCSWRPIHCSSDPNWTAWTEMLLPPWSNDN